MTFPLGYTQMISSPPSSNLCTRHDRFLSSRIKLVVPLCCSLHELLRRAVCLECPLTKTVSLCNNVDETHPYYYTQLSARSQLFHQPYTSRSRVSLHHYRATRCRKLLCMYRALRHVYQGKTLLVHPNPCIDQSCNHSVLLSISQVLT